MSYLWWQMPGPKQFVSRIAQDLSDGKNVIVCTPLVFPAALSRVVRAEMETYNDPDWHTISICDEDIVDPVGLLFSRFIPDYASDSIKNAITLAQNERFSDKVLWVQDIPQCAWPLWKEFIAEYQHACRNVSKLNRSVFCIQVIGENDLPSRDICLAYHKYFNKISRLDMLLYSSHQLQEANMPDLQKRLAIAVITDIAGWDPQVCEILARATIGNILEPREILRKVAEERGWHLLEKPDWNWEKGIFNIIEGEKKFHSSVFWNVDPFKEIDRRIWSAEVGILFPFVEERRQQIITTLKDILVVPYKDSFGGIINDIYDLEIGHIENQIYNNLMIRVDMKIFIKKLKEIRNALSHLEPVQLDLILCDEIYRHASISAFSYV